MSYDPLSDSDWAAVPKLPKPRRRWVVDSEVTDCYSPAARCLEPSCGFRTHGRLTSVEARAHVQSHRDHIVVGAAMLVAVRWVARREEYDTPPNLTDTVAPVVDDVDDVDDVEFTYNQWNAH